MKHKRFVGISIVGAMILIGVLAILLAPRSATAARSLSPQALAIISAPDSAAGVSPFDLQCSAKVPGGLMQCGSQASSCKNCHEVKGEDPVNAKGDWHVSHAFGDFCEFCHGGNVQATDEAAAHQDMVAPLGDLKANCSSCHADDYQAKAEPYAKTLGITLGASVSGSNSTPTAPSAPDQPAPQQPAPAAQPAQVAAAQPAPAATPTSSEIIDYVAQYRAGHPLPLSGGTIATSLLLVMTVVGGGTFVAWNEKRLRRLPRQPASPAVTTDERSQELAHLMPLLEKLDAQTLRALRTLLSNRR